MKACDDCLRRARLVADLAPRIAALVGRPGARAPGLLALPDVRLIEAAAGERGDQARERLERFEPDAERALLQDHGVLATCRHAQEYPPGLLDMTDPPAALFAVGEPGVLAEMHDRPSVAIVGTRAPSPYGAEVAHALGRGLGASGVIVVSGLALGIDATAHRGCLNGGGTPVAVLAGGPERAYPRRHRLLHEAVAREGLVLSELPPRATAYRWSFPARNRIMAGLARLTVVVEAADPSGSLITADFARDLGRTVAAVPGRVTSRMAHGTNGLLRDGAVPVTGTEDVLDELYGAGIRPRSVTEPRRSAPDPRLKALLDAVEAGCAVDEMAGRVGRTTADVRAALGRLEAEGHVVRGTLGGWERTAG